MNKKPTNQNEKVEEQIENTQIDGKMEAAPEDTAEIKIVDGTADTLVAEMPDGEIVEIDKESIVPPEESTICADHVSRTKILNVIESTMAKYEGKVVLAMEEVRDIINAITTAVKE